MRYEEKLIIPKNTAEWIDKIMETEPKTEKECFGEDEKFTRVVVFPDGTQMDIEICGVQYREGEINLPWTQACLYDSGGYNVDFTEPSDAFFGTWWLENDTDIYVVYVEKET